MLFTRDEWPVTPPGHDAAQKRGFSGRRQRKEATSRPAPLFSRRVDVFIFYLLLQPWPRHEVPLRGNSPKRRRTARFKHLRKRAAAPVFFELWSHPRGRLASWVKESRLSSTAKGNRCLSRFLQARPPNVFPLMSDSRVCEFLITETSSWITARCTRRASAAVQDSHRATNRRFVSRALRGFEKKTEILGASHYRLLMRRTKMLALASLFQFSPPFLD